MPALNYDYDYYEYRNGRRTSSASVQSKTPNAKMTNTTRKVTQSRNATPKKNVVSKRSVEKVQTKKQTSTAQTSKRKVATNIKSGIDIPLTSSKKIINKPKEMTLTKPKIKSKTKSNVGVTLKNVALVSMFFALFFMVCYRYSVINEEFSEINTLKGDLIKIQNANDQVQADIESKTDLTYVENYAKYQLGMQKPSSSQIQYVSVEKQDKITTPVTIAEESELNWFEKIVSELRKIID